MDIRKIILEEIDDLDWIRNTNENVPTVGTAWDIININSGDRVKVQEYLFSIGYSWAGDNGTIRIRDYRISSLQSIFSDMIEDQTFTYSMKSNIDETIDFIRKHSTNIEELYVYNWDGDKTVLVDVISL